MLLLVTKSSLLYTVGGRHIVSGSVYKIFFNESLWDSVLGQSHVYTHTKTGHYLQGDKLSLAQRFFSGY